MADPKEDLINIFGRENVLCDAKILDTYSKDESFAPRQKPRFIVRARNAAQLEQLVQWANRTRIPLVPQSSGAPHFRGDTIPSVPGAVIADMSGMKKIIRIDRRNRMAIIEPGVTYSQLQPELAGHGLRLSSPLAPRPNKSVIGALLEREPITVPRFQWSLLDPLRCTEVIWGDGRRMTTGEAKSTEALEEEWAKHMAQVNPAGPGQTNFYKFTSAAQGSIGIVTWASVKCDVLPKIHRLFFAPADQLEHLLDLAYDILRIRFGDELLLMNGWNLAMLLEKDAGSIADLAERLPPWILMVGIAGRDRLPEERVLYQEEDISAMAQGRGLQFLPALPAADGEKTLRSISNTCGKPYWKHSFKGGCQDLFFLNTLDRAPEFIKAAFRTAESHGYPLHEIGVYLQPIQQGVGCHIELNMPFDPSDAVEKAEIQKIFEEASRELLKLGAYFSRPYGIWSPMVFEPDSHATVVLKKIKGIFDPNNIMNPGKLCF